MSWRSHGNTIRARLAGWPEAWARDLASFVEHAIDVKAKQAAVAARTRQERTERVEQGVRSALGVAPVVRDSVALVRNRIERRKPEAFGLTHVPTDAVIRRAIRVVDAERKQTMSSTSEHAHSFSLPPHASVLSSTFATT